MALGRDTRGTRAVESREINSVGDYLCPADTGSEPAFKCSLGRNSNADSSLKPPVHPAVNRATPGMISPAIPSVVFCRYSRRGIARSTASASAVHN